MPKTSILTHAFVIMQEGKSLPRESRRRAAARHFPACRPVASRIFLIGYLIDEFGIAAGIAHFELWQQYDLLTGFLHRSTLDSID